MNAFGDAYNRSLVRGARAAIDDVLAVKKGERVLIVTNPAVQTRQISMALYDAALENGAVPVLMFQREKSLFDYAEEEVIKSIGSVPDVAISISSDRLGKDKYGLKKGYKGSKRKFNHIFNWLYEEGKMRVFWSPGITRDTFARAVPIDYRRMRQDAVRLSKILSTSDKVWVTAPGGTDITIGLKGRKPRADDGDFSRPGLGGNVPSGEVFVSPELGSAEGTIAFDGSIVLTEGEIVIRRPILVEVERGYITRISGGTEARRLKESVIEGERKARRMGRSREMKPAIAEKYARNAWSIGELGIGLNRKARIVALMLEDEKVYGTCHFAVGSNYDGDADAMIHLDGLVKSPTIVASSRVGKETEFMADGKLAWD